MLRKQIIKITPANPVPQPGEIDIAAVATVQVTSEAPDDPIDPGNHRRRLTHARSSAKRVSSKRIMGRHPSSVVCYSISMFI